jgi:hypothetical protein
LSKSLERWIVQKFELRGSRSILAFSCDTEPTTISFAAGRGRRTKGRGLEKLGVKTSVSRRASWYAGGEVKRC